jgi:two-component system chemotaxis sensor kinase CheA
MLGLERIGRAEAIWHALVNGANDDEAVRTISRDLHTLKGDASVVGYNEVHVLAHKVEELVGLASELEFQVSDDVELVMTIAMQFLGMLLRTRQALAIDLDGFVRQVDEVIRETRLLRRQPSSIARMAAVLPDSADRLSERTRQRLAGVATDAFLEYVGARGAASRARLRGIWRTLRDELTQIETVAVAPLLARHVPACRQLAGELGKDVDVSIDVGAMRLEPRVAEALDQALLHILRNSIDHGIEEPAARIASGKPARGTVRVTARELDNWFECIITDDGGGLDLEAVRAKAAERGLVGADATDRELADLIFVPGFTTRSVADEVSGRGIGMDAAKSAITKIGGRLRLDLTRTPGFSITVGVPAPMRQLRCYHFLAPNGAINFAISGRWTPTIVDRDPRQALDPLQAVSLVGGSRQTATKWARDSARDLVLELRWGFLELFVRVASAPQLVTAERICPTADDAPVEVVMIDGVEALLLRPEHLVKR